MEESEYAKVKSRKPEWDLSILHPVTSKKGKIGAGWDNQDGSISIQLNTNVVLDEREGNSIRLFKRG